MAGADIYADGNTDPDSRAGTIANLFWEKYAVRLNQSRGQEFTAREAEIAFRNCLGPLEGTALVKLLKHDRETREAILERVEQLLDLSSERRALILQIVKIVRRRTIANLKALIKKLWR